MRDKLNILFKSYVLTLFALIIGYTSIHWLFFIKLDLFSLKEVITNFGIPIFLTGIVVLTLIRPKFKILNLEAKRGDSYRDFYSVILWIILTIPLVLSQEYIRTSTGELTELDSIREINNHKATKYYTLKNYYIGKRNIGIHTSFETTGRNNENFNMSIYIAMPIFEKEGDEFKDQPLGWLGMKYSERISNSLEDNEKVAKYQEFVQESELAFNRKDVSDFVYLDRIGNSDDKEGYTKAIKSNSAYNSTENILIGVDQPFEARNGDKLMWIFVSISIGSIIWLIMLLIPKIDQDELNRIKKGQPDIKLQEDIQDIISLLKPQGEYFVTPILIYINVGIYLLMFIMGLGFISFGGEDLLKWGANYGPYTKNGEWWRLLTSTFLHGGLMHLAANMYGLLFVGIFLEPILGRIKYLVVYLSTGILASIASIYWYDATISVGASGAIFGLYGVFLALLLMKVYPPGFAKSFLIATSVFIGFNLLMGLGGGIDNAAHIGGLLSGFILGFILYPTLKQQSDNL